MTGRYWIPGVSQLWSYAPGCRGQFQEFEKLLKAAHALTSLGLEMTRPGADITMH